VGWPFFEEVWYAPGSPFPPATKVIHIESSAERLAFNWPASVGIVSDPRAALAALLAAVPAPSEGATRRNEALRGLKAQDAEAQRARAAKRWNNSPIAVPRAMAEIEAALPADAILVDEAITASTDLARTVQFERVGDYVGARGGGIGQALPGALGVKLAHPERPVLAVSGDGSAMYSIQALWTAAHHDLAVVFLILNNREYRILKHNMDTYRQRFGAKPERGYPHMDLVAPDLGFVELARGMGVDGARVSKPDELRPAIEKALAGRRPFVLDVAVEGRA
jgi:benzoylformate decarboxylase